MKPAAQRALEGWLEYIQPRTWKWWTDGGYWIDRKGDAR